MPGTKEKSTQTMESVLTTKKPADIETGGPPKLICDLLTKNVLKYKAEAKKLKGIRLKLHFFPYTLYILASPYLTFFPA